MGLKKLARKVDDYNARLEEGKADRIKPGHVHKVLEKLRRKVAELEAAMNEAETSEEKARIDGKLGIARTHVERAEWLLRELD